jgi:hypothetical protein
MEIGDTGRSPYWWHAKKVDKPSYTISSNKYRLINHEINVPGIASWNPVTIEIVDVGKAVKSLMDQLSQFGYDPNSLGKDTGLAKTDALGQIGNIRIEQLDGNGDALETWRLNGAFFSEVRFGTLDYAMDEIVSIVITVTYDYATLE